MPKPWPITLRWFSTRRTDAASLSTGTPYIGYYDGGREIVKLAHREGQAWMTETIDPNESGYTSALAIGQGTIWISYTDQANHGVKVARAAFDDIRGRGPSKLGANVTAQQRH